jgi:hypothetical protein
MVFKADYYQFVSDKFKYFTDFVINTSAFFL